MDHAISSDIEHGTATRRDVAHDKRSATWPATRAEKRPTEPQGNFMRRWTTALLTPEKALSHEPTWAQSFNAALKASWLNVLLICIPISWVLHFTVEDKQPVVVFVFSLLAIIPLAKLLGFATEELSLRVGQTIGASQVD